MVIICLLDFSMKKSQEKETIIVQVIDFTCGLSFWRGELEKLELRVEHFSGMLILCNLARALGGTIERLRSYK